jgi:pimeloyl-ACP methyl ester carboxylesterase
VSERSEDDPCRRAWPLRSRLDVSGTTIAWDRFGSGPAVVLVHGFPGNSYCWRQIAPDLARTRGVSLRPPRLRRLGERCRRSRVASRPSKASRPTPRSVATRGTRARRARSRRVGRARSSPLRGHIVWGEEDTWLPVAQGERLRSLLPNAHLITIPSAGHFLMEDAPRRVLQTVALCLGFDVAPGMT